MHISIYYKGISYVYSPLYTRYTPIPHMGCAYGSVVRAFATKTWRFYIPCAIVNTTASSALFRYCVGVYFIITLNFTAHQYCKSCLFTRCKENVCLRRYNCRASDWLRDGLFSIKIIISGYYCQLMNDFNKILNSLKTSEIPCLFP